VLISPQPQKRPRSSFHAAAREFDLPASLLSDNAAVFTGRSRRRKVLLELVGACDE
jgi:hypothetical protein